MTEKEWLTSGSPNAMLQHCWSGASARKKRLFGCACCYRLGDRFPDPRCRTAVHVAERFADGEGTTEALDTAYRSARSVIRSHTRRGRGKYDDEPEELFGGTAACSHVASPDIDHVRWAWNDIANTRLEAGAKWHAELTATSDLIRDIFGNPFRPAGSAADWRTDTVVLLARQMYESREFSAMPILADALQDAGCDNDDILSHCRGAGPHARGCWVVDLVLGKQ